MNTANAEWPGFSYDYLEDDPPLAELPQASERLPQRASHWTARPESRFAVSAHEANPSEGSSKARSRRRERGKEAAGPASDSSEGSDEEDAPGSSIARQRLRKKGEKKAVTYEDGAL